MQMLQQPTGHQTVPICGSDGPDGVDGCAGVDGVLEFVTTKVTPSCRMETV